MHANNIQYCKFNMQNSKKTYLNVPYAQKDAAKALGAKWDPAKKRWYAPADKDTSLFSKWQAHTETTAPQETKSKPGSSRKNVVLGITTYGKNKELTDKAGDSPPWD